MKNFSEHTKAVFSNMNTNYDEMNNLPEQFEAILKDNLFKNN